MSSYDVIVVGGGPAGASAAAEAARAGLRVALIEKRPLPRHKTCGGGMPMTVGETLRDLVAGAFVESNVTSMRHTFQWSDPFLAPINPPGTARPITIWMVQRSIFDNALVERAAKAGAEIIDDHALRNIRVDGATVHVEAISGASIETQFKANRVIGADGANGVTAKFAGLRPKRTLAIGMEVEHPHDWKSGHADLRPDVMHLEYGAVSGGYAWVFPKADHLNVGAGFFRSRGENSKSGSKAREELQRSICAYLDLLGVPYEQDKMHFYAHPLPLWNGREPLQTSDARILLAGDAAGMVNPFFGDGILHAIRSGKMAAQSIVDGQPESYTKRIHDEYARNMEGANKIAKLFYRWPSVCYKMGVKRDSATHIAAKLLCGEAMFDDVAGKVMSKLSRAIKPSILAKIKTEHD